MSFSSDDPGAATVPSTALTFDATNWNVAQSVTVTPADDADGADESVTVSLSASDSTAPEYASVTGSLSVTVDDDETPALTIASDTTPLALVEGGAAGSFTVALAVPPKSGEVKVSFSSDDAGAATVPSTALTFDATNWNVAQSVTVTPADDADGADESVTVSLSASGSTAPEYASVTGSLSVTVDDDETPALTIASDTTPLALVEGGAAGSFTVALAVPPKSGEVKVSFSSDDPGAATVPSTALTFDATNWNVAQSVTVTPADDADGADESVTVSLSASDSTAPEYASVTGSLSVEVDDDETPGLTIASDTTPLALVEGGAAGSFTVALAVPPKSGEVKVSFSSDDPGAATVPSTALTFDATNWNVAQSVTVTPADDADGADESVTVSLSASDSTAPEYASVTGSLSVTVDDDETPALTIASDTTPLALVEGGAAGSFTVALAVPPKSGEVKVSFSSDDPGAATVPSTALTFDATNWNVAQSVTVTPADDADGADESVTVSLSASDSTAPEYASVTGSLSVTVDDDETPALAVSPTDPLSLTEGHAVDKEKTFTVALATQPTATVTVGVTNPNTDALTVDATSLSFTTTNWKTAQTVKVTAKDDGDGEDESVTIGLGASGGDYAGLTGSVLVNVTDDDIPTVTLVLTPLSIDEAPDSRNRTATVTATLDLTSSRDTTIKIEATPGQNATSNDFNLSYNKVLTIKAGETASTGTAVTITSVDNDVDSLDKKVVVSAEEATNSKGVKPPQDVSLTIIDDDATPTVELKLKDTSISEGGTTEVWAELSHASAATTTLTLSTSGDNVDLSDSVGENNTLTIAAGSTTSNRLTITPDPDTEDEPERTLTISASVSNDQNGLDAPRIPTSLSLTITDDDAKPTLEIALDLVKIKENGGVATVTAKLLNNRTSSEDTTIEIEATPGQNATSNDFNLSDNKVLTIKAGETASTGTAVTITGVNNTVDAPDKTVTVSVGRVTNSHQAPDAPTTPLTLTIEDDEEKPTVTLILGSDTIDEDRTTTVRAVLDHPSSAETTMNLSVDVDEVGFSDNDGENNTLTIALGSTTSNELTITPKDNNIDEPNRSVTISATASNDQGVTGPASLTLTINDDEATPGLTLALDPSTIPEGGNTTLTATLTGGVSSAATSVTVTVTPGSSAEASDVSWTSRTLTIAAGSTSAEVELNATENNVDADDKRFTISATAQNAHAAPGDPQSQTLTVTDNDDPPTIVLVVDPSRISEDGGVATVRARTNGKASSVETTITVTAAPVSPTVAGDFTMTGTTLTIAAGQTSSTGSVTITAVDNDVETEDRTIAVSATAQNSRSLTGSVADVILTIIEDESYFPEERRPVLKVIFAEMAQGTLAGAADTIGHRFDATPRSQSLTLAGRRVSVTAGLSDTEIDWWEHIDPEDGKPIVESQSFEEDDLLRTSAFTLPLVGDDAQMHDGPEWTIWGRGDWHGFKGRMDGDSWDGKQLTGWLGADARMNERLLAGIAVSRVSGESEYRIDLGTGDFGDGEIETSLTAVWPYVQMSMENGGSLSLILGAGTGTSEHRPKDEPIENVDLSFLAGSLGGQVPLTSGDGFTLSAIGGANLARLKTEETTSAPAIGGIKAESWRLWGGVEARHEGVALSESGATAAWRGSLRVRQDGGDGLTGTGAEITSGILLSSPSSRFSVDMYGRWLAMHSEDGAGSWGAGLEARLRPGPDGRGLSLSLVPEWGSMQSGALDGDNAFASDRDDEPGAATLTARSGFGFAMGKGLMTPFIEVQLKDGEHESERYSAGVTYTTPGGFDAEIVGERHVSKESTTSIGASVRFDF